MRGLKAASAACPLGTRLSGESAVEILIDAPFGHRLLRSADIVAVSRKPDCGRPVIEQRSTRGLGSKARPARRRAFANLLGLAIAMFPHLGDADNADIRDVTFRLRCLRERAPGLEERLEIRKNLRPTA